jgi:predicted nuclease of predicted toxin-antitoxin system
VRLLLDEPLSPRIAQQLRDAGHDVAAVAERDDLRSQPDETIWRTALAEGRALVTGDLADFLAFAAADGHDGTLVLVARGRFARSRDGIGNVVAALDALLRAPEDVGRPIHWLEPAP